MSRTDSKVIAELEKMYPSLELYEIEKMLGEDEQYYMFLIKGDAQGYKGEKNAAQRSLRILAKYDEVKKRMDEERRVKYEEEEKVRRAEAAARKAAREAKMKEKADADAEEAARRKMMAKSAEGAFRAYEASKKEEEDKYVAMFKAEAGGAAAEPTNAEKINAKIKTIKEQLMEKRAMKHAATLTGSELEEFNALPLEEKNKVVNRVLIAKKRFEERKKEERAAVMAEEPRQTVIIKKSFAMKNLSPDASAIRDIESIVVKKVKEHVASLPIYGMKQKTSE